MPVEPFAFDTKIISPVDPDPAVNPPNVTPGKITEVSVETSLGLNGITTPDVVERAKTSGLEY